MNNPCPGDILTKQEVMDILTRNIHTAYSEDNGEYERLRDLFETSFGCAEDINLKFDKELSKFIVWK